MVHSNVYFFDFNTPCDAGKGHVEHRDWMQWNWNQMLFNDESGFSQECEAGQGFGVREKGH